MQFIAYVAAFVTALGAFTYLCVPKSWHKGASTLVFIVLACGAFGVAFESAGQPKPVSMEWRDLTNLPVVGFAKNEDAKVIYFWVLRDGIPVSYAYPWSDNTQGLEDLWRARGQYDGMFLTGNDEEAVVRPEDNLPPKDVEAP